MNIKNIYSLPCVAGLLLALGALSSCNKDSDSETFTYPVNLGVSAFSLAADINNPGLETAYFSIDLEHGVIFNADSLKKGTPINKVIPKITFTSDVTEAVIVMSGGTTRTGEVDFKTNPTDSIDFTGNVELRLKAAGDISATYRIKVNVHNENPDTLIWSQVADRQFPSRLPSPVSRKTVEYDGKGVTLIEEADGTYTSLLSRSFGPWEHTIQAVTLPFTPQVRTLTASDDALWILDTNGELWKGTTELDSWNTTGQIWTSMIGGYNNSVVGLRDDNGRKVFAQYPLTELNVKEIPDDFPISGISNFVTLKNQWTLSPVAFFTGGVTANGTYSDITWAFDGAEWIKLCTGGIPALSGASIIPYYNYRKSADNQSMIEYKVWMLLGGRKADGEFNRVVYVSYDNGVNWAQGVETLQLPEFLPAMTECDNVVALIEKEADLSTGWNFRSGPARVNYWTDGSDIMWECPYIFLFGGMQPDGTLNSNVWRGVLNRLTFTPII